MPQGAFYVTKTTLEGFEEVRIDGRSVLEAWPTLQATLSSRGGRELAELFAEPVPTRGNDAAPTSISWYAAFDAEPIRLTGLDPGARAAPEARLREQLAELTRLLDDPEIGPLLGGALHVGALDDIWVLDGRPLLTNWGVLPTAAARSSRTREEHFRQSLGRYLALAQAPPLTSDDWRARRGQSGPARPAVAAAVPAAAASAATGAAAAGAAMAASRSAGATTPGAAESAATAGGAGSAAPPPPGGGGTIHVVTSRRGGRTWIGPLIAVVVLALILGYLLIPGVLLYPPEPPPAAAPGPGDDLTLRRDINHALEDRAKALREAVGQNVCRADGQLVLPDGTPLNGAGGEGGAGGAPGAKAGPSPNALVPPDPGALTVPPGAEAATTPSFQGSLVDLLDQATVLVVVAGEHGAIGSGFFVAPETVVTNRHVVEGAAPDQLFVTNQKLGGLQPARIKDITASSTIGGPDFAVLEVPSAAHLPQLALTSRVERLENVVAGGFPGVIMDTDVNFQALRNGDPTAIPQMAVTQGVVTVIQKAGPDLPIIVHTANISPGNSGGPLVDSCGRVVGINTFIRVDQESSSRLNYALQASALAAFLSEHGIPHTLLDDPCQPQVASAPPPAQAQPGTQPSSPTPAPETGAPSAPAANANPPAPATGAKPSAPPAGAKPPPSPAPEPGAPTQPPPPPPGAAPKR